MAANIPMGSMSTEIKLNGSQSVRTLRELKQAVTQATSAWKAQRAELSTIGKSTKAAEAKYKGLAETINKQKDYISGLREAQKHLQEAQKSVDRSTREGRQEYGKYNEALQKNETRIHSAEQRLAGLANQQSKAHKSLDYYKSGLADVQKQLKSSESVTRSYVDRLQSEGKSYEAAKAKLAGYRSSLEILNKQQKIQEAELSKIASTAGKSSDAFKQQQVRVNETATSINKTKSNMSALNDTIKKTNPSIFDRLKDKLHGTSNEAKDTSHNIMDIAKGSAIGNMVSNGFSNLGSALWSAAQNGFKLDEAGEELKKRWSDLGLPKRAVKGLMDQISRIRGVSNASGSSINQLQRSLYNLTNGNVGHVKALTNELFAFGKQAGLSDGKIAGMGQKLTRVFSQSKVRLSAFNRAFGQMPGLRDAIIKASGMSKKAFNNALANGKISGTQLQKLMIKASSKSGKAWERFGSTTKGQLAKAQGQYTNMTAMFMKPIEFISIKALNGVMSQLVNKRGGLTKTGSAIQGIVKNLSKNIGKGITNTIDFIVHHTQGIKTFGEIVAGAFAAKKIYDFTGSIQKGIGAVADDIDAFKKLAKSTSMADVAQKLLNVDEKANPIGLIAVAVAALGVAFYELYNHCKPFRNFVNSIGKQVVKVFNGVVKFFKNNWKEIGELIVNPIQGGFDLLYKNNKGFRKWVNGLVKGFKNAWKGVGKWFGNIGKGIQKSWKGMTKWFTKLGKNMSKGIKSSWKGVTKWFSKIGKNIQKSWKGMTKWFTKLGKNMSKGIKSSWKGVTKWFSNVGKDIQKAWKGMTKWFTKLGKNMSKGIKSSWKSMVKWFSGIAEDIKKAWHGMTSWFSKLGHGMASGLKSAWKHVTGWFSDIGKGIRNAWRGMTSWFSHLGSNMASGIKSGWHGMTSWFTNLAKSIKSVFDHLWSGIKDGAASIINTIIDDINGTGKNISNFTHGKIKFGKIEHVHFYQGTGPIKNPILGVLNDGNDSPATGNREGLLHKNGLLEVLNGTNIKRLLLPGDEVIKASDMASLFHFADGTVTPATNLSGTPAGLNNQGGLGLLINITDDILQAITGETVSNFTPTKTVIHGINSIRSTPVVTPLSKSPINNKNSDKTGKLGKSTDIKDKADIKDLKEQTAEMQKAVVVSKQFVKSIASVEKQVKALYKTLKKNPFGKYISSQATKAVKALKGKGNFAKVIKSMNSKMSKDIKKTNSANLKNIKSFSSSMIKTFKSLSSANLKNIKRFSSSMIKTFKSLSSNIKKIWSELWSYTDDKFKSWRKDELSDESSFKSKFTHGWKSMDSGIKSEFNHFWSSMVTTAGRGVNTVIKVLNEAIGRIDSVISDFGGSKNAVSKSSYVHYAKGTDANGRLTHDTLAIVNDAQSGPRQEAVVTDTNDIILPKGNNVPMVLRKGWGVLDGTQTQSLGLPHFANGTGLKALYEIAKHNWNHPVKTGQNMFSAVSGLTGAMKELASGMRSKSEDSGVNWWSQLWKMVEDKVNDGVPAKGLLKAVEKYGEGHKYVWGADGPSAFDCSGLVMYALRKRYGIDFPHYSGAQYARTEHISKRNAKMGDLVFWGAGGSDHVGVYAGGNKYFSAESPSQGIHMNTLSSVVGKGSPLFGRVKGLKQDDGSSSEVKANNALQRHIKPQVGKGFWKTVNKIAEKFGATAGSIANPAGDGVQRWASIVEKALRVLHLSSSLKSKVLRQIATESSGDPHAMGGTDGLSDGHAEGLMQVKPPTFASYHLSGHNHIWNGFDNMLAGLNYAKHRYGSNLSGLGMGHGYANGGLASAPSIFGEAGPEMAIPLIPSKSTRAWELIGKAIGILSANSNFNNQQQVNVKEQKEEHDFRQAVLLLLNEIAGKSDVAKITLTTPAGRALWEVVEPYSKQEQRAEQIRERRGLSGRFR